MRSQQAPGEDAAPVTAATFDLPTRRAGDLRTIRSLSSEITTRGADLHSLLGNEATLRVRGRGKRKEKGNKKKKK
jgi:hypothetical protein